MMRSLYTASSGMKVNQTYVDNISNNLSNVNTVGFKKSKIEFEDLMYQTVKEPGSENGDGTKAPVGVQIGLGAKVTSSHKIFIQGSLELTGRELDVAISGEGFFQVRLPSGEIGYTRTGSFKVNAEGYLTTSNGELLEPNIVVPDGANDLTISTDGTVAAILVAGGETEELGQIELARFINPSGLRALGGNMLTQTDASGDPVVGTPGLDGYGELRNQYLESSNVQMIEEMVQMIVAQRAYEISSKAITTSDEMLQTASGLKR